MTGRRNEPLTFPEGTFPEALKALRAKAGLSQDQAGVALGLRRPGNFGEWERGAKMPSPLAQEGAIARLRKLSAARKRNPA